MLNNRAENLRGYVNNSRGATYNVTKIRTQGGTSIKTQGINRGNAVRIKTNVSSFNSGSVSRIKTQRASISSETSNHFSRKMDNMSYRMGKVGANADGFKTNVILFPNDLSKESNFTSVTEGRIKDGINSGKKGNIFGNDKGRYGSKLYKARSRKFLIGGLKFSKRVTHKVVKASVHYANTMISEGLNGANKDDNKNDTGVQLITSPLKVLQQARLTKERIKKAKEAKKVLKTATQKIVKAVVSFARFLITCWPAALLFAVIFAVATVIGALVGHEEGDDGAGYRAERAFDQDVEKHRKDVIETLKKYGLSPGYTDLILAIIAEETGGKKSDVMQSSRFKGLATDSITDSKESIDAGIQQIQKIVNESDKLKILDMKSILQAYNFDLEFLKYINDNNNGKWTEELAKKYYDDKKKSNKDYHGDPQFPVKVLNWIRKVEMKEAVEASTGSSSSGHSGSSSGGSHRHYGGSGSSEPGKVHERAHITQELLDEIVDKAPTDTAKAILSYALSKEGMPYSQPERATHRAYDCSSLVYYACCNAGFDFGVGMDAWPPTAALEEEYCQKHDLIIGGIDDLDQLQPGDIIFYTNATKVCHVAIYAGDGMIIHAANEKVGVVYQGLYTSTGDQWIKSIARIR